MHFARVNGRKDESKIIKKKEVKIKLTCKLSVSTETIEPRKEDLWKIEYL